MSNTYESYIALKVQIDLLEEKADKMKEAVIAEMQKAQIDQVAHADGTLNLQEHTTWKYPADIEVAADLLKSQQKEAQRLGTATPSTKPKLVFKRAK